MGNSKKMTPKKIIAIVIAAVVVIAGVVLSLVAGAFREPEIIASGDNYEYVNSDKAKAQPDDGFTIDGVLDEEQYQQCAWLKLQNTQGGAGADIAMTSFYGEKGMYIVYDVTESSMIYVNPDRATYLNSCIEMYLASSDVASMSSNKIFEIDMLPDGQLRFRQRTARGNWVNAATTDDIMACLGATTKGGPVNTEECTGYYLELFIPWEYLDKLGLDASAMKQDFVYINPVHITSYNYEGTNSGTDRYWYSFATQMGSDGWGDVAQYFRFGERGVIGTVPVELVKGNNYTITGNDSVIPGMMTTIQIVPDEGYALSSILVNGEEYIHRVSYNKDGSVTLELRGGKDGLKITASAEPVTDGDKTLSGTVQVHKLGGDTLDGVSISYKGATGEKPITLDSDGKFELSGLPQGYYTITVEKKGYAPINRGIYLNRDIETELVLEYQMFQAETGYNWILDDQNDGLLNRFGGSGKILSVDSYDKFAVEAVFKYDTELAEMSDGDTFKQQRSGIQIKFSNGKYWRVDLLNENGVYKVQYAKHSVSSVFNWKAVHTLTAEEVAQYQSEEGIKLSVLRDGNYAWVCLNGKPVAIEVLDDEYKTCTAQIGFEGWVANQEIEQMQYNITRDIGRNLRSFHFTTNTKWDISGQLQGELALPGGGTNAIAFYNSYTDFNIALKNVKEHDTTGEKPSRTDLLLEFDTDGDGKADKSVSFGIVCTNPETKSCWVQTLGNANNYIPAVRVNGLYKLNAEETEKYLNGDGVELRLIRSGTDVYVFVNGEEVAIWDLTQNNSGVTADMKAELTLRLYDTQGNAELAFEVSDEAGEVRIDKVFKDNENWDLSNQYQGEVALPGGGTETSLEFFKKYQNIDLTVIAKENDTTGEKPGRTDVLFEFDLDNDGTADKNVSFGIVQLSGGRCVIQTLGWNKDFIPEIRVNELYELDYAETLKYKGEGIALRVVRYETTVYLYLEDKQVAVFDLTQNNSGVEADTKASVFLRHYDAVADEIVIPFEVTDQVEKPEIEEQPKPVFQKNRYWDLSKQNLGTVTVNGVEAIKGIASLPGGGTNTVVYYDQYTDLDLTITAKENDTTGSKPGWTDVLFEFDLDNDGTMDKSVSFGITKTSSGCWVQTLGNKNNHIPATRVNGLYKLNDAEAEKYLSGDGVELRLIRKGTNVYVLVEGKLVSTFDLTQNSSGVTADMKATVSLRHYDAAADQVDIPFTITEEFADVTITDNSVNGEMVTGNANYAVGTEVALSSTANEGYYLAALKVDGTEVKFAADGTYSFIATKPSYTVEGIFKEAVFESNYNTDLWNALKQFEGVVSLPNGGGATAYPLEFREKFVNVDLSLTVRDYPDEGATDARTDVQFVFDNGETVTFGVVKTGGKYRIQSRAGTLLNWNTSYYITDQDLIDSYVVTEAELSSGNPGGMDFRVVRYGTEFYLYLNGTMVKGYDFSYDIEADTPVTVYLRHYDDAGQSVEIPFTVTDEVTISDPRLFAEKEAVTDYAYSFAVLPDTQIVTENDAVNGEENLAKLFDWIIANQESKNIRYVFGLGDITENNNEAEWTLAQTQYAKLTAAGIPYSAIRGNHDLPTYRKDENAENYNTDDYTNYIGTEAYRAQFDGFYSEDNISNSWRTFAVGDVKYLMLTLDYGASDDVLDWASGIIYQHPDRNVIITTHAYLYRDGTTLDSGDAVPPSTSGGVNDGDDIWDKLVSKHENIVLVMCGHDPNENIVVNRTEGENGNVVTSMLIDAQDVESIEGSMGMVAMLYFSEDGKNIQVEYYSTAKEKYFKSENQFSAELDVVDGSYVYGTGYVPVKGQQVKTTESYATFPRTIEVTFNRTNLTNRSILIGSCDGKTTDYINLEAPINEAIIYLNMTLNGTTYRHSFNRVSAPAGETLRVTVVIEDAAVKCYINGVLAQSRTATNGGDGSKSVAALLESAANAKLPVGYGFGDDLRGTDAHYFIGTIYDVALWSDARTAEEIAKYTIANVRTAGYQDNLLAAYDFRAGYEASEVNPFHTDLSGKGYTLTGTLNVGTSVTSQVAYVRA